MIVSLSIFSSIFAYLESSKNRVKMIAKKGINLTFIFIIFLFSVWEIVNLTTFDLNVSYSLLFCLYATVFSIIVLGFGSIYTWFWIKQKQYWKILVQKLPLLITLLFLSIFFLFFYRKLGTWQSDMWSYYQLMNILHTNGTNQMTSTRASSFGQYLPVGFYQFGSSLNLTARFYLMPFLTTYLFFYFCIVVAYDIIEKFFFNSQWKINLIFGAVFAVIIFFYLFYNFEFHYSTLEGDWVACSYNLLLLLPFLMNIKQISNKLQISLIVFFLLFMSETSSSLIVFALPLLIVFTIFYRKKNNFSFFFFWTLILCFVLSLYLAIVTTFSFSHIITSETAELHLLFALPFVTYLLIIIFATSWFLLFINKRKQILRNVLLWNTNLLNINQSYTWFKKKNFLVTCTCILYITFILIVSVFDIFDHTKLSDFTLLCAIVGWIVLFVCFSIVIKNRKINITFNFFIVYATLIFLIHLILFKLNIFPSFFLTRLNYSSFYIGSNYFLTIRIIIFALFFFLNGINLQKLLFNFNFINKLLKVKLSGKSLFIQSTLLLTAFVAIPVPTYQAIINANSSPAVNTPKNLFFFGLSTFQLNELNSFNFHHELTFSDLYLPILNNSTRFNLTYNLFPPYSQLPQFYSNLLNARFNNIDGLPIKFNYSGLATNLNLYVNDILPYYSYVCVRKNDTFFIKAMQTLDHSFKQEENIDNAIYIYVNNALNKNAQNEFIKWNQTVLN